MQVNSQGALVLGGTGTTEQYGEHNHQEHRAKSTSLSGGKHWVALQLPTRGRSSPNKDLEADVGGRAPITQILSSVFAHQVLAHFLGKQR